MVDITTSLGAAQIAQLREMIIAISTFSADRRVWIEGRSESALHDRAHRLMLETLL